MNKLTDPIFLFLLVLFFACNSGTTSMDKKEHNMSEMTNNKVVYTCPMHPEIIKDKPGNCPICGMALVKKGDETNIASEDTLDFILQPSDQQVLAKIPVVKPEQKTIEPELNYQGVTSFIPQNSVVISSRITGRVENIFVKYNYQKVVKGQKLFTIYSPELLTEQNNLLFLLKQDANNLTLIEASKNKLRLLGFSENELSEIIKSEKPLMAVTVYSNYNGFITEINNNMTNGSLMGMNKTNETTSLTIKQGSYLQKGQSVFTVIDNSKLWIILSVPEYDLTLVNVGDKVRFKTETSAEKEYKGEISYIEPLLDGNKKTTNARVIIDNTIAQIPISTQVNATVLGKSFTGYWIPSSSVIDLGIHQAVLVKDKLGFKVTIVKTGIKHQSLVQIISGINNSDEIALNAQYLMDSESFIKQTNK